MTKELLSKKYIYGIDPYLKNEYQEDNIFYKKTVNLKNDSLIFLLTPHSIFKDLISGAQSKE